MYLLADFQQALADEVASRPDAATLYKAGDPRMLAQMGAIAAQLQMLSAQVDVAEVEPFLKARDGTVLADAALKGILPLGSPARVSLTVTNPGTASVTLSAGRVVLDRKGRPYRIEAAATVPPATTAAGVTTNGTATVTAVQVTVREVQHVVPLGMPFYALELPASDEDAVLVGLAVADTDSQFTYRPDYCNVQPGERVFHVETDEYRRVFVRFGADDPAMGRVIGHQPATGDVITVTVTECAGAVDAVAGEGFALEYTQTGADAGLQLTLAQVLSAGANAPSIETLRMLARYPALHDEDAVFLGDFTMLLRRKLDGAEFVTVWNEVTEEAARGASVANINKLFVAYSTPDMTDAAAQALITAVIRRADSSYRVVFKTRRDVALPITVTASVSAVHDPDDVAAQIRAVLLAQYGRGSVAAAFGLLRPFRNQAAQQLLKKNIPALQDQGADFSISVGVSGAALPEDFVYLTAASITANVTRQDNAAGLWNG